jgi:hypothetical protein
MHREETKWFTGHSGKKDILDSYQTKSWKDIELKKNLLKEYNIAPERVESL